MKTNPGPNKSEICGKASICGVEIDRYSFHQVVEIALRYVQAPHPRPAYIVTPNAQHILLWQQDAYFRQVYQHALLVVPDGVSLLWAARLLCMPLRGRVNGTDLFEHLCQVAAQENLGVYLLGGRPGAAAAAADLLQGRYPALRIVGTYCPPYGFEADPGELARITHSIKTAAPDFLFVGLGTPKQEFWIHTNYTKLNVPLSIGIGASIDFVSGFVRRAPLWMQKVGLEWLFRLASEPGRLWRRYLVGLPHFWYGVLGQRLGLLRFD
jgi:N-acetylglucosaminyldiphosphoundecaprenol N-acetyl-beta-D-mannosaminyltransferase